MKTSQRQWEPKRVERRYGSGTTHRRLWALPRHGATPTGPMLLMVGSIGAVVWVASAVAPEADEAAVRTPPFVETADSSWDAQRWCIGNRVDARPDLRWHRSLHDAARAAWGEAAQARVDAPAQPRPFDDAGLLFADAGLTTPENSLIDMPIAVPCAPVGGGTLLRPFEDEHETLGLEAPPAVATLRRWDDTIIATGAPGTVTGRGTQPDGSGIAAPWIARMAWERDAGFTTPTSGIRKPDEAAGSSKAASSRHLAAGSFLLSILLFSTAWVTGERASSDHPPRGPPQVVRS